MTGYLLSKIIIIFFFPHVVCTFCVTANTDKTRNLIWWLQLETRQSSVTCPLLSRVLERYIDNPNRHSKANKPPSHLPVGKNPRVRQYATQSSADYSVKMSRPLGRIIISTKRAPAAIGPYNQAVQVNINPLFISYLNSLYPFRLDW